MELELKRQLKAELELNNMELTDLKHLEKSVLFQKYGIWNATVGKDELIYWEMREEEDYYVRALWTH